MLMMSIIIRMMTFGYKPTKLNNNNHNNNNYYYYHHNHHTIYYQIKQKNVSLKE